MILTVSPVPLVATMSGEHVLSATTYSKSVLRVAAQEAMDAYENCWYFPSYEIITGPQARGLYFRDDLREVSVHGVDHVMRVFANAFCSPEVAATQTDPRARTGTAAPVTAREQENLIARVVCDEEVLAQHDADS